MENTEILDLYNRQQRIELDYPDVHREVAGNVIRHISTNGEFGFVIYSNLDENNIEAAIEEQVAHFAGLNMAFEWKVYDYDRPADLKERLVKHGFTIGDAEALLVLDLYSEPLVLIYPISPLVRQVSQPGEIDKIMHLEETVWGESHAEHGKRLKKDLVETPERLAVYAAYDGDTAVSAAWMYYHPGTDFASLWGGTTLPAYRRQGLYTSLLAVRAQRALSSGYRFITVDASPMSRPILEKHGFQFLGYSYPCEWTPGKESGIRYQMRGIKR
jgi:GNAT superfamily N-acetyltransferase